MIKELRLQNYALAKDIHIEFDSGLNIITGESGAGKSVIISAIDLLTWLTCQSGFYSLW